MSSMYFFSSSPSRNSTVQQPYIAGAIDIVDPATGLGKYSGKSLTEIQLEYPDASVVPYEDALKRSEDACIKAPWEIDSDRFYSMLGEGMPGRRTIRGDDESFYITDRLTGSVVMWAICVGGDRYFELHNRSTLDHQSVVGECRTFMQRSEASASPAPCLVQ